MGTDGAGAALEGVGVQPTDRVGGDSNPGDLTSGGIVYNKLENWRKKVVQQSIRGSMGAKRRLVSAPLYWQLKKGDLLWMN